MLVVVTEQEMQKLLAERAGNTVAIVEAPAAPKAKRTRKSKAKPEAKAEQPKHENRDHRSLDTTTMPTVPGEIEMGDTVEYIAQSNGQAKAYKVTYLKRDKYNPGNVLKLDGFLWRNESLCRRIVDCKAQAEAVPF